MNRKLFLITAVIVLGLAEYQSCQEVTAPLAPTLSAAPVQANYRVKRVADGDNITVEVSQKLPPIVST